ncbi:cobalamin B12-binding domain-containing protein [Streptomyces sp. HUAS TT20]|uniref:cobalamin B12-binding domain-containing protein n=1 Tax=Streptomyces sp. HUAS TT20 TaxID=3447509 RepID=UPI0021DA54AD|nr:cobalamin-dependent protein [Streptomyces sp. HUAS 15-9]UXY32179.1 cobalamin-dependent protein [Streptomyces sp. HUAS 15-9]
MTGASVVPPGLRAAFDDHLAHADDTGATALALDLLRSGASAEEILLRLIAPAQAAVGARWVSTEWSVAREHAATHVSERAVSAVAAAASASRPRTSAPGRRVLCACVEGERHTLPARITAEVLRLRGFDLTFLGANVLVPRLVSHVHRQGPDLVALSCMIPVRLPAAHRLIDCCRRAGVPVLAGGAGFGPAGVWARTLGADLYAPDPATAADMLAVRWPDRPRETAPLEHLADEEYSRIVRQRTELLRRLLARLRERYPRLCDPGAEHAEAVLEDLGRIPDVLAAANYVDDPRVLTDYLSFGVAFLHARGMPTSALGLALGILSGPLGDLPRASAHLDAGRRWLAAAGQAVPPE